MYNTKLNKILITGGAGFIGSHLTDRLLEAGYSVTVLDDLSNGSLNNLEEASRSGNFQFIEGDILSQSACRAAVTGADFIFHMACLGVRNSIHSPFENHRVNAEGTLRILEAARQKKIRHFFYISTSEIYGRTTDFPIAESAATNPLTVYGASKLAGEHYTRAYHECYNLPVTILRIFNNYGPRAHYEGDAGEVIPRSIVKILYNKAPVLFGDGNITRDFFYVKDTAFALQRVLELTIMNKETLLGETINIGTGAELKMRELLEKVLLVMGRQDLEINYMPDRPADVPRLWVDAERFRQVTSFKPAYSFEDGLNETIEYYKMKVQHADLLSAIQEINWVK